MSTLLSFVFKEEELRTLEIDNPNVRYQPQQPPELFCVGCADRNRNGIHGLAHTIRSWCSALKKMASVCSPFPSPAAGDV